MRASVVRTCAQAFVASLALAGCLSSANGEAPSSEPAATVSAGPTAGGGEMSVESEPAGPGGGFAEILSLEIRHDYFPDGLCSVCAVVPSAETAAMLRGTGARFRFQGGSGMVVAPSADVLRTGDPLTFVVSVTDPEFQRYTAADDPVLSSGIADFSLTDDPTARTWAVVEIAAGGTPPIEATVALSAPPVLWRWIVLPGPQSGSLADWTVRRANAPDTPVDQDPPEAVEVNGRPAWQFTLRGALPLRQSPPENQRFVLVPPPGAGVSGPIPLPSAGVASVSSHLVPGEPAYAEMFVTL